jgi:type II secretory pathway pseudopilin PulG
MKLPARFPSPNPGTPAVPAAAFTLPELVFAVMVLLMLLAALLGANLYGMRMYQLSQTKLTTTDALRKALARLTDEVRACNTTWVGTVSNGVFVACVNGQRQAGTSLVIYPTTNRANFIAYFVNASDQSFRRTTTVPRATTILAQSITNTGVFQAQDYLGNILTNNQNNRVIHLCLESFQPQPYLPVPDYYKLETSVTRRALQ